MLPTEGIISIIGLTLSVFTLINLVTQSHKHRTDLLLCFWLIIVSLPLVHAILGLTDITFTLFRYYTNPALSLLLGPLLYCYVFLLIREKERLRKIYLLHLIPFILFYFLFIFSSYLHPIMPDPDPQNMPAAPSESTIFMALSWPLMANFGVISILFFIGYSILTISLLLKHQKNIGTVFSQNENQISLKWIYMLPASFITLVLLNIANEHSIVFSSMISSSTLQLFSSLSFIILLSYFGIKQKPVFTSPELIKHSAQDITEKAKLEENESKEVIKITEKQPEPATIAISEQEILDAIVQMKVYMESEKPYLEASFTVYDFAEALNIPRRTLSHILSHGLSMNFFQYVNELRIKEVKQRLKNTQDKQLNILDIAFESGFNSKSSFNRLFKQYCHLTPSQYRKKILGKNKEV